MTQGSTAGGPSAFASLHPALQYHVVNTLGWAELRPLQESAVGPVTGGHDVLLAAPTAGGKTEAVMLPLLSRAEAGRWRGLSVLYICPLRALLNNLEPRLAAMGGWLGRRAAVWHGDVAASARRRITADPPDILLTTPESLEAMLLSAQADHVWLFANLRAVVVDELHAFAGDDRGWHLLGVLARLSRLAGRQVQRIALSATVGNPAELLGWLADGSLAPRTVVRPPVSPEVPSEAGLDYVGSLRGAATVIARLHQGAKRLVFCDSRAQAEQLATALRSYGVQTFVSHSSLSRDARRQAETAFESGSSCVIVATSTLELGVDVGDLDHVFQVDVPPTVAAFLQRLGRTGRRPGTARNAMLLATRPGALWTGAALLLLWQHGYVEPVVPPTLPRHIVAQQLLGLVLQERRLARADMLTWLGGLAYVPGAGEVLDYLIAERFLTEDAGLVWVGPRAESEFGRRFFLDLTSAFTSDPGFTVVYGRDVLGEVSALALAASRGSGPPVILLGGRSWAITHVDWRRRQARAEPSERPGRSRWAAGGGRAMSHALARAHHDVLAGRDPDVQMSRRARDGLEELRAEHRFVAQGSAFSTFLVRRGSAPPIWWTFAGLAANRALASGLGDITVPGAPVTDLALPLRPEVPPGQLQYVLGSRREGLLAAEPSVDDQAIENLKFSAAIPRDLARDTVSRRLADQEAVQETLDAPLKAVTK
jgi:ATP-dependent Lhr-like helicase